MPKNFDDDNENVDAILNTGEFDIDEELEQLGGYHEYIRENERLGGEDRQFYRE